MAVRTIPQRELRNDNARVIEAVLAGESFLVTRNGEPVAELRPHAATRRTFVPKAALFGGPGATPIDHRQLRADLDAAVDQRL